MEALRPHRSLNRRLSTMASAVAGEWYAWLLNKAVTTVRSLTSLKDAATRHLSLKPPPSTEALKIRNSSRSPGEQWQSQQCRRLAPAAHALGALKAWGSHGKNTAHAQTPSTAHPTLHSGSLLRSCLSLSCKMGTVMTSTLQDPRVSEGTGIHDP